VIVHVRFFTDEEILAEEVWRFGRWSWKDGLAKKLVKMKMELKYLGSS